MNPEPDNSWQRRRRSWVVAAVLVVAVIAAALLAGKHTAPGSQSRPRVAFGAELQPPAASGGFLQYTNGWAATSGNRTVAVYAGSVPTQRQEGLLVIERGATNTVNGIKRRTVVLRGTGPLTLLRPAQPATEAQAADTLVHFVTASGATGTLNLGSDKVAINR